MKKIPLIVLPLFLVLPILPAATLTVDNNAGSVAMYSSLGTAIAEAAPGDVLLLAGSPNHYGDHNI